MVTTQGHVRKRPFQPSITSYFSSSCNGTSSSTRPATSSPPLPEDTQASLLSVGMRVRKSVPEGYKTHKTTAITPQIYNIPIPASSLPSIVPSSSARELQPFCGLHKIGGLSSQPEQYLSPSSSQFYNQAFSGELPPLSTSSTLGSTFSSSYASQPPASGIYSLSDPATKTKKRTHNEEHDFNEDIENRLDAIFDEMNDLPDEVFATTPATSTRIFARPRRKAAARSMCQQQEVLMKGAEDFEDAEFLVPTEEERMDLEE